MCLVVILPRKNTFERNTVSKIPNQTLCICVKVCIVNELLEPHARFAPVYCHLLYYTLSKRKSSFYKTRPLICTLPCTYAWAGRNMFKSWETSGSGPPSYFPSIPIGKNACANVLYVIQTHNSNESDFIDNSIELNKLNAKSAKINRIVRWSTR